MPLLGELALARLAHPVGRPGRGVSVVFRRVAETGGGQGEHDVRRGWRRRRGIPNTWGVIVTVTVSPSKRTSRSTPRSAIVSTGTSGRRRRDDLAGALQRRGHHVAPGCRRASTCISARSGRTRGWCRPRRPPADDAGYRRDRHVFLGEHGRPRRRHGAGWRGARRCPRACRAGLVAEQFVEVRPGVVEGRRGSGERDSSVPRRDGASLHGVDRGGSPPPSRPWRRPPRARDRGCRELGGTARAGTSTRAVPGDRVREVAVRQLEHHALRKSRSSRQ